MQLQPPVLAQMGGYWLLRCALAPVVLFNMSISGILQVLSTGFIHKPYSCHKSCIS